MQHIHSLSAVLLGFTIDDQKFVEIVQRSAVMPTQTHRFAWNLVGALKTAGLEISLLSVLPIPNYPEYPEVIIRGTDVNQDDAQGVTMGFLNLVVVKHVTRFASCLRTGAQFVKSRHPDVVVVHGVHTPFLVFARMLKRRQKLSICLVMTDPPGVFRTSDGMLVRWLKRLDRRLLKVLASGFDGVVCLTPALATDFAPSVPRLVLEGFANPELSQISSEASRYPGQVHVAYAGGISSEYGVDNLIQAFRRMRAPHARLELYGKGPLDTWVMQQCQEDSRISHHGLIAHEELMPKLKHASILVNPRPAGQEFVRYSFPSKILEYMALGVPVITTRLAGLPNEYLQFLQLTDDDSVAALADALELVMHDYSTAEERAARGQQYVICEKSVIAQGRRLSAFLYQIGAAKK